MQGGRRPDPDATKRRIHTAFAVTGLAVVAIYAAALIALLLSSTGQDAFGGGRLRGGHDGSPLVDATALVVSSISYLALLAVWSAARRSWHPLLRNMVVAGGMWILVVLYLHAFGSLEFHRRDWNRVFAHVSVVLYAVTLSIGPLARLWSTAARAMAWRRETGIWATFAAVVHVLVYWEGSYGFAGWRRFFYNAGRTGDVADTLMGGTPFHLANVVGLLALAYGLVLALTSNDASQRWLRGGWTWLMRRATTMWLLVLLHVWAFAYFVQGMGVLRLGTLWISFFAVLVLQTVAFAKTVWMQRSRTSSSEATLGSS